MNPNETNKTTETAETPEAAAANGTTKTTEATSFYGTNAATETAEIPETTGSYGTNEATTYGVNHPGTAADTPPAFSQPEPIRKDRLSLADLTFSILFIIVGVIAIAVALGVQVSLWEIGVGLVGAAGLILLIGAFVTARK